MTGETETGYLDMFYLSIVIQFGHPSFLEVQEVRLQSKEFTQSELLKVIKTHFHGWNLMQKNFASGDTVHFLKHANSNQSSC